MIGPGSSGNRLVVDELVALQGDAGRLLDKVTSHLLSLVVRHVRQRQVVFQYVAKSYQLPGRVQIDSPFLAI